MSVRITGTMSHTFLVGRDSVVLDIGANQGFYSMLAAAHGCRVVSFEPQPECQRGLLAARARNGFTDAQLGRGMSTCRAARACVPSCTRRLHPAGARSVSPRIALPAPRWVRCFLPLRRCDWHNSSGRPPRRLICGPYVAPQCTARGSAVCMARPHQCVST